MKLANKKVLIIYQPWEWGKYENTLVFPMIDELNSLGAVVQLLDIVNPPYFKKSGFINKIKNLYWRNIKKNNNFYHIEEINHFGKFYISKLHELKYEKYDYTLVIRPDLYSKKFLTQLRRKSKQVVGYMWDGITSFQSDQLASTQSLFDTILAFNKEDITNFPELNLKFITNFYYSYSPKFHYNQKDLLYVGGIYINRKDIISYQFCNEITQNFAIIIFLDRGYLKPEEFISDEKIKYIYQHIPYLSTLDIISGTKCILDICRTDHKGLSFRFFESIYLQKKIITNNKDVINYDFYHPDNILIIEDFDCFDTQKVKDFLEVPYKSIDRKIVESYSFKNWFFKLFNIQ